MTCAGRAERAASGPLLAALAASVALHAALFAGLPDLRTSARPATAPMNARLVAGVRAAATEPLPVTAEEAVSDAPLPRPPSRKPLQSAASPPAGAPTERTPPAAVARPAAEPVLATGVPTLAPRPGDDALDAGSLAQYRLALIGAAKRFKDYPAEAIDRGLEGRVDVRLVVGADGTLSTATVKRTSGHQVLDREAVDTIRRAMAATPIPPALRGREVAVEIPLVYELKRDG